MRLQGDVKQEPMRSAILLLQYGFQECVKLGFIWIDTDYMGCIQGDIGTLRH